jgi:hypothetical protein
MRIQPRFNPGAVIQAHWQIPLGIDRWLNSWPVIGGSAIMAGPLF